MRSNRPTRSAVRRACAATAAAATSAAAVLGLSTGASAGGPPEVVSFERTSVSGLLTEECGVEVTQALSGYFRVVDHGTRTLTNFHFRSTLTAGDNVVESRAFGPTIEEWRADGSGTRIQLGATMRNVRGTGQTGATTGRVVVEVSPDGEEVVVFQAGHDGTDFEGLCAALTA